MIGLAYHGDLIAGVVNIPAMKQVYHALRGLGRFRDDIDAGKIRVSTVDTLAKAHVYYSSISWFQKAGREQQFLNLVRQTERQRGFGDFYGFLAWSPRGPARSWSSTAFIPGISARLRCRSSRKPAAQADRVGRQTRHRQARRARQQRLAARASPAHHSRRLSMPTAPPKATEPDTTPPRCGPRGL